VAQTSTALQQEAATIQGIVRNPAGEPVEGASVLLEGTDKKTTETKTDANGKFFFSHCRFDAYSIHATKSGFDDSAIAALKIIEQGNSQLVLLLKTKGSGSVHSANPPSAGSAAEIEFDDKPNFVIAGVKDWSNADLHGSAANARTSESLNQGTLALKSHDATAESSGASAAAKEAGTHRLEAERLEKAGDPLAAEREYEAAVRLDPSEENYFAWGAELLVHRANQPAAEVFARGAKAHPQSWRMRAGLGAALFASNSYEEAAQRFCEAGQLSPRTAAPYIFLGEIEKSTTAPLPCADESLAGFLREQPENARANYYYAIALWKRARGSEPKNLKRAETLLAKAVALDPRFAEAHLQLGIVQSDRGASEQAGASYRKAIELQPDLAEAHHRLALTYRRLGDEAKAQQEFAAYQGAEKAGAAALEKRHQQLRQFLVILSDHATNPAPR
jgi:Tfp pilus assembly protein PilF